MPFIMLFSFFVVSIFGFSPRVNFTRLSYI